MILYRGHAGIIQAGHVCLSMRSSESMQKIGCLVDPEVFSVFKNVMETKKKM